MYITGKNSVGGGGGGRWVQASTHVQRATGVGDGVDVPVEGLKRREPGDHATPLYH